MEMEGEAARTPGQLEGGGQGKEGGVTEGCPWTEKGPKVVPEIGQMSSGEKDGGRQSLGEEMNHGGTTLRLGSHLHSSGRSAGSGGNSLCLRPGSDFGSGHYPRVT